MRVPGNGSLYCLVALRYCSYRLVHVYPLIRFVPKKCGPVKGKILWYRTKVLRLWNIKITKKCQLLLRYISHRLQYLSIGSRRHFQYRLSVWKWKKNDTPKVNSQIAEEEMVRPFDCYNNQPKKNGRKAIYSIYYMIVTFFFLGSGLDPSTPIGSLLVFLRVCRWCFSPSRREEEKKKSIVKHKRDLLFCPGHHSFFSPLPYSRRRKMLNPASIKMYGSFSFGLFVAFRTLSSRTKVNTFVGTNITRLCVRASNKPDGPLLSHPRHKRATGIDSCRWPLMERKKEERNGATRGWYSS